MLLSDDILKVQMQNLAEPETSRDLFHVRPVELR